LAARQSASVAVTAAASTSTPPNATVTISPRTPAAKTAAKKRSAAVVADDDDEEVANGVSSPAVQSTQAANMRGRKRDTGDARGSSPSFNDANGEGENKAPLSSPSVSDGRLYPYSSDTLRATKSNEMKMVDGEPVEAMALTSTMDIADLVIGRRSLPCRVDAFDLGNIALHRLELIWNDSKQGSSTTSTTKTAATPQRLRFVACYSEVAQFTHAWATPNRKKVHLADGCHLTLPSSSGSPGSQSGVTIASPFGQRGGRYLYMVRPAGEWVDHSISLVVWQHQYPLRWKYDWISHVTLNPSTSTISEQILASCQRNLIACVDGAIVDTCGRERALWTGDLWASLTAMRSLCSGDSHNEVALLSLRQIASTYDNNNGMVSGCAATRTPDYHLAMPTYHLLWCITVLDFNEHVQKLNSSSSTTSPSAMPSSTKSAPPGFTKPTETKTTSASSTSTPTATSSSTAASQQVDPEYKAMMAATAKSMVVHLPRLLQLVKDSLAVWKVKYLRGGMITGTPGWNFVDWDMSGIDPNNDTVGRQGGHGIVNGPNSVVHALWYHVCYRLGISSGLDQKLFIKNFWTETGFSMLPYAPGAPSGGSSTTVSPPSSSGGRGGGRGRGRGGHHSHNNQPSSSSGVSTSTNPHSTSTILAFASDLLDTKQIDASYHYLQTSFTSGQLSNRMTPYYAYYTALAFDRRSHSLATNFIESYYWPKIKSTGTGTIQEKCSDTASRAHGWSVGIAAILLANRQ
jgi:hypothetical protein